MVVEGSGDSSRSRAISAHNALDGVIAPWRSSSIGVLPSVLPNAPFARLEMLTAERPHFRQVTMEPFAGRPC
jgi:hypothetical protein